MKGSYALVLNLPQAQQITVGKLGPQPFLPGYYIYFGSALNSLEGRLRRHLKADKKHHWHIDFLSAVADIEQVWWSTGDSRRECSWTQSALACPNVTVPVKGFGSSDCRSCPSHLVQVPDSQIVNTLARQVSASHRSPVTPDFLENLSNLAS